MARTKCDVYQVGKYQVEVWDSGVEKWFLNGEYHREDGPAIIWPNGDKEWFLNGLCHREDGPAIERVNGHKWWYLHGENMSEEEWRDQLKNNA